MAEEKIRVYITVDTETSLGGAWRNPQYAPLPLDLPVFGKIDSGDYGIPLIMDILEEHGFRGTFFTEVFCSYFVGEDEVAKVCRIVNDRGHDCQLHLHPVYRFFRDFKAGKLRREVDLMWQLSTEEQHDFIGEGAELFRQYNGKPARAYRAGCYGASEVTLGALKASGIAIDSSYNLAYLEQTRGFKTPGLNAPTVIADVHEFPVTNFRVAGASGYKPLEISSVSVNEMVATIRSLRAAGCSDAVLVLHSSSLLKNIGLRFERATPDHIIINRMRKLCATLSNMRNEVDVCTLGDMDLQSVRVPQPQAIPTLGWLQPAMRKVVQAANRLPWL